MGKTILSVVILAISIIGAVILFNVIFDAYPEFGTFENLLFLGLTGFGLALGILLSAVILHNAINEKR